MASAILPEDHYNKSQQPFEPKYANADHEQVVVRSMGRSHKRSKKQQRAYNHTSAKNKRKGTLRGKNFVAKYAALGDLTPPKSHPTALEAGTAP